MSRENAKDEIKAAFARDPRKLVDALGLRVDERKSNAGGGRSLWVFDGNETEASLQIGGKPGMEGLCSRYGDDWHGDCFGLVQRVRPQDSFVMRLEFVAGLYGIQLDEPAARRREAPAKAIAQHSYPVPVDGQVVAVHRREDREDGSKAMWWEGPEGTRGLPEGVNLPDLPLWRSEHLPESLKRAVIVCEGEKDADAIAEHGGLSLGTYGADVTPTPAALAPLVGRKVFLWPDADDVGMRHMARVAQAMHEAGIACWVLDWQDAPAKAGAADWFAAGKTTDELKSMLAAAHPYVPQVDDEQVPESLQTAIDGLTYAAPEGVFRGARPVAEIAGDIICNVDARRLLPRRIYGMRTGWKTVDWFFCGFRWQGLMLLSADSGAGKTTVARHCIYATAEAIREEGSDGRLLVYVLEGGREQFLRYYAGWKYGVPSNLMRPGSEEHMTDDWKDRLYTAYAEFAELPIDLCDTTREADAILFDIERRATEGPIEGVILDNIQMLEYSRGGNEWANSKRSALRALDLADTLEFPFLVLSQVNAVGREWKERGGPEWRNNATCVFYAERGEKGAPKEERGQSNLLRLYNTKARYEDTCCPLVCLRGNQQTGRLHEEVQPQGPAPIEHDDPFDKRRLA